MTGVVSLIILIGGLIALRMLAEKFLTVTGKRSRLFILVYVGILLLSLPVAYVIASSQNREDPSQILIRAEEAADAFYKAIHEGKLPAAEHISKLQHWTVSHEGSSLTISSHGKSDAMVLVSRQQHSGKDIRITYYTTPHVLNQINFTHLISPPDVFLANNHLFISPSSTSLDLKFVGLRKDSYIAHFTGEGSSHGYTHTRGNGFFYVEVPLGLKIEATDGIRLILVED